MAEKSWKYRRGKRLRFVRCCGDDAWFIDDEPGVFYSRVVEWLYVKVDKHTNFGEQVWLEIKRRRKADVRDSHGPKSLIQSRKLKRGCVKAKIPPARTVKCWRTSCVYHSTCGALWYRADKPRPKPMDCPDYRNKNEVVKDGTGQKVPKMRK